MHSSKLCVPFLFSHNLLLLLLSHNLLTFPLSHTLISFQLYHTLLSILLRLTLILSRLSRILLSPQSSPLTLYLPLMHRASSPPSSLLFLPFFCLPLLHPFLLPLISCYPLPSLA